MSFLHEILVQCILYLNHHHLSIGIQELLPIPPTVKRPGLKRVKNKGKYFNSFVQNDASQDKELNRRIGLAVMSFGKLKGMVFTSKKVSLRVKCNVYSAMVLSVLLHGAAESWALFRTQLSRLETLHNSWLR